MDDKDHSPEAQRACEGVKALRRIADGIAWLQKAVAELIKR